MPTGITIIKSSISNTLLINSVLREYHRLKYTEVIISKNKSIHSDSLSKYVKKFRDKTVFMMFPWAKTQYSKPKGVKNSSLIPSAVGPTKIILSFKSYCRIFFESYKSEKGIWVNAMEGTKEIRISFCDADEIGNLRLSMKLYVWRDALS